MASCRSHWLLAGGLLLQVSAVPGAEVEVAEVVDMGELEQRLQRLERIVQGQGLSELLLKLEQLEAEVRRLQGENEELGYEIDNLKEQQRELYLDLDRRLQKLNASEESLSPPSEMTEAGTMDSAPDSGEPAYQAALKLLKEGRYEEAMAAFRQFPQQYPESRYRPNAQYWLGESYYMLRDFSAAAQAFQALAEQYPESAKVPDAMLKQGLAYYELEQWEQAKAQLQEVMARYPASTVSRLAEDRLEKMKREGHR
ncbi:tol-pal system protein YbgF [Nitrosococcus halophilus Nc 4]|uniref:Cell division coordinator CpoB n=1 Tax=Nitrosococcus halophilus (strain Nc4) TaxID=472759 RepID=D5C4X2_NITHN|nr:tol-pal system protein YbgF [Nitrosococcus halophilus]ADE13395.1 tol-pal system protein YbgF [Nitrosococcus halophilus Nc 4]